MARVAQLAVVCALFGVGCGFQAVPNGGDGGMGGGGGVTGPGPYGALPAGFCCTGAAQCRSRQCVAIGGQRVCSDPCDSNDTCTAFGAALTCNQPNGSCDITNGFTCLDPSTWTVGTRPLGACCRSGFPQSGQECDGGLCESVNLSAGWTPFFCTRGCTSGAECPPGWGCFPAGFCAPDDNGQAFSCTP